MAEGARLESVYTRNRIEGSNPSLTAKLKKKGPDENQDPFSLMHLPIFSHQQGGLETLLEDSL